jgi:2-iminobutanoate/2-iminopropanoate deaminase
LPELAQFASMNEVYATLFPENPPARAALQAAHLQRDVRIEIAAIAVR